MITTSSMVMAVAVTEVLLRLVIFEVEEVVSYYHL
jgi:hypothetical protein